jgi:SAM-dependent methyltransferase
MDRSGNSIEDLEAALADIAIVNRRLGGEKVLLDAAGPYLRPPEDGRPLEILDVGTGGADLPAALLREARASGIAARVAAIELDPKTAAIAGRRVEPGLHVVRADAFRLPFRDRRFDLVCASLFLHHFSEEEGARLLRGLARVCRGTILVNDLERHVVPWAFIAVAARLTGRHPMFVHDAPLSVLRGFTRSELASIAERAGLREIRVEARWPFRLVLTGAPGTA